MQVFSDGDCFGAQRRNATTFCQLCHSIAGESHRRDQDRIGQLKETAPKFSPAISGPSTGEGSTSGTHDALAEPYIVEIRRCQFVRLHKLAELAPLFTTEYISQKMIVEYDETHVVARSGSSANEATNAACSSRLRRSPRRCWACPAGTVSTPKPRSITSTGPPSSSCHRCRTAAGSDSWPEDDTRYR